MASRSPTRTARSTERRLAEARGRAGGTHRACPSLTSVPTAELPLPSHCHGPAIGSDPRPATATPFIGVAWQRRVAVAPAAGDTRRDPPGAVSEILKNKNDTGQGNRCLSTGVGHPSDNARPLNVDAGGVPGITIHLHSPLRTPPTRPVALLRHVNLTNALTNIVTIYVLTTTI